jgi:hypothetical protein
MGILAMTGGAGKASNPDEASIPPEMIYFGQQPPGRSPEVFAPGEISDAGYRLHGPVAFSPDLSEVCWAVIPPAIMSRTLSDGVWSDAKQIELAGRAIQSPAFSSDGGRLYYQAVMDGFEGVNIWCADRMPDGWGPPTNVGATINSDRLQSQPCLSAVNTLYYTGTLEGSGFDRGIYLSRFIDNEFQPPELLCESINSKYIDYCPWVSPDESYLLFASSRPREEEPLYLYITFRQTDGSWSEPQNIHTALGFESEARFPSVSPDGRFLFFISGNRAYWVDIAPVLELRP